MITCADWENGTAAFGDVVTGESDKTSFRLTASIFEACDQEFAYQYVK